MAINSNSIVQDTKKPKSRSSSNTSNLSSRQLIKINCSGRESSSSTKSKKYINIKDNKSPYLTNDKVQLLSRVTQKKLLHKKPIVAISSFPLAVNVYKANSDELKVPKRDSKKVKKSVLTLPNEQAPMPKMYTVSDLNDSEYFNDTYDKSKKTKKRRGFKRNKKLRTRDPEMEYYDRDARYCSQMNIDLDCSSSEIVNINGDGKCISKLSHKCNNAIKADNDPHDIWAVLRNINEIQFRSSPSPSQERVVPLRKRRPIIKRRNNRSNDTHIIETCRTEEFSYISSFEVDSKSHGSVSPSSSFDRVTVIDKQSDEDFIKKFSQKIFGSSPNTHVKTKAITNKQYQDRIKPPLFNSNKRLSSNKNKKYNNHIVTYNEHDKILQRDNNNVTDCIIDNPMLQEIKTLVTNKSNMSINSENTYRSFGTVCESPTNALAIVARPRNHNKVHDQKGHIESPKGKITKSYGHSEKQMNGITKVIVSQGNDVVSTKNSDPARKPRLALPLPNTRVPKLTQTEIKRKLASLKFPIVILGKEQLTNRGIHVFNNDPPHLNGLGQHIWPFMIEWCENKDAPIIQDGRKKEIITKNTKTKCKDNHKDVPNIDAFLQNDQEDFGNRNDISLRSSPEDSRSKTPKPKSIGIFKSKMFKFLHKTSCPVQDAERTLHNSDTQTVGLNQTTNENNSRTHYNEIVKTHVESKLLKKNNSSLRRPWAKAKWTNDFIENVIKKIRNGVYTIGEDRREIKCRIWSAEVSTQTETNVFKNVSCQNSSNQDNLGLEKTLYEKHDPLKEIPGFNKAVSTLEIKTISKNKIAVKHCITNVVVQFDIEVFAEDRNTKATFTKKSISCTPIRQKNNEEKIFKCNTSILNANLPAELCSIIPSIMKTLLNAERKLSQPFAIVQKNESTLAAISELSGFEIPNMYSFLPGYFVSKELKSILEGQFTSINVKTESIPKMDLNLPIDTKNSIATVFPSFNAHLLCNFNQHYNNLHYCKALRTISKIVEKSNKYKSRTSTCMSLQPFNPNSLALVPSKGFFNVYDFVMKMVNNFYFNNQLFSKFQVRSSSCNYSVIIVNGPAIFGINEYENVKMITPVIKFGVISLFEAFTTSNDDNKEVISESSISTDKSFTGNMKEAHVIIGKNKITLENKDRRKKKPSNKRSYVKCYRKCNSMSSISSNKSTLLSKITNIEEFCRAMGSSALSSVLNGSSERKILGALEELKNWIVEISPKQALLVLLLTNKKDTPNLIRFRPVILQGIAVNRITRAVELDTEVEVIERENFSKSPQYDGIFYLPASAKNQDNLLEELYWIAKTTASDYQRTFDESSEKLLKSLLEKRKKLNPSYLRVMARYVGLGLLNPRK